MRQFMFNYKLLDDVAPVLRSRPAPEIPIMPANYPATMPARVKRFNDRWRYLIGHEWDAHYERPEGTTLYFVRLDPEDAPLVIKIGITSALYARRTHMRDTAPGNELVAKMQSDGHDAEMFAHRVAMFTPGVVHKGHEVFRFPDERTLAAVVSHVKQYAVADHDERYPQGQRVLALANRTN